MHFKPISPREQTIDKNGLVLVCSYTFKRKEKELCFINESESMNDC